MRHEGLVARPWRSAFIDQSLVEPEGFVIVFLHAVARRIHCRQLPARAGMTAARPHRGKPSAPRPCGRSCRRKSRSGTSTHGPFCSLAADCANDGSGIAAVKNSASDQATAAVNAVHMRLLLLDRIVVISQTVIPKVGVTLLSLVRGRLAAPRRHLLRPVYGGKWARGFRHTLKQIIADKCCQFVTRRRFHGVYQSETRAYRAKENPAAQATGFRNGRSNDA
jgi:hypothetical protein